MNIYVELYGLNIYVELMDMNNYVGIVFLHRGTVDKGPVNVLLPRSYSNLHANVSIKSRSQRQVPDIPYTL